MAPQRDPTFFNHLQQLTDDELLDLIIAAGCSSGPVADLLTIFQREWDKRHPEDPFGGREAGRS